MRRLEDPSDIMAANFGYLLILGRNPENEDVIHHAASIPRTISELRSSALDSPEYKGRQRLDIIDLYFRNILSENKELKYQFNSTSDEIILLQTSDPIRYLSILSVSAKFNARYCKKFGMDYQAFVGLKQGFYPHHAMLNRIFLLKEYCDKNFRGWIVYVDADAVNIAPNYDLPYKLAQLRESKKWASFYTVQHPDDEEFIFWNVNTGVFALDLSANRTRMLIRLWHLLYSDLITKEEFRHAVTWDGIINDQNSLHEILRMLDNYILLCDEIELNQEIGKPFIQALRSSATSIPADEELSLRCASLAELGAAAWRDIS